MLCSAVGILTKCESEFLVHSQLSILAHSLAEISAASGCAGTQLPVRAAPLPAVEAPILTTPISFLPSLLWLLLSFALDVLVGVNAIGAPLRTPRR